LEPNTTNQNTGLQGQEVRVVMPTLIWLTIPFYANQSDYIFPNLNFAVFGEYFQNFLQLFYHPGFRFEKIRTQAEGSYRKINLDLAGNVILDENQQENNVKDRNFVFGVGLSYKPQNQIELYGISKLSFGDF
jgi:Fe(3+) dicitrate transport protein